MLYDNSLYTPRCRRGPEPLARVLPAGCSAIVHEPMNGELRSWIICKQRDNFSLFQATVAEPPVWSMSALIKTNHPCKVRKRVMTGPQKISYLYPVSILTVRLQEGSVQTVSYSPNHCRKKIHPDR